jgi:hypothetical protein
VDDGQKIARPQFQQNSLIVANRFELRKLYHPRLIDYLRQMSFANINRSVRFACSYGQ